MARPGAAAAGALMPRLCSPPCSSLCDAEIADSAFDPENYRQIMGVLARRLQERVRWTAACL